MALESIKKNFIGGLIVASPLIATYLIIKIFLDWTSIFIEPIISFANFTQYTENSILAAQIIVVIIMTGVITFTGLLARSRYGERIFGNFSKVVHLVPLVRTVYFSFKNVANAMVERRSMYEKAVAVEYPRENIYRIGFTTSESPENIQKLEDEKVYNVFIPNSPNPTGGQLAMIPENKIHYLDMSVKQALKHTMTTGISEEKMKEESEI